MTSIPVYRTISVPKGFTFELPFAAGAWRLITGVMGRQPPGLYVHPDDPRTDEQIRKAHAQSTHSTLRA